MVCRAFCRFGNDVGGKEEIQTALELEPVSLPINADAGQILYFPDEYNKASEHCNGAIALDADFINGYGCLYKIYTKKEFFRKPFQPFSNTKKLPKSNAKM